MCDMLSLLEKLIYRRKTAGFFTVFCILQFGSISQYFNTFTQVMVSKASATNYDIKTRHWGLKG